jgi:hypothetical protein
MQTDGTGSRVSHMVSSLFHFDKYISGENLIEKINDVTLEDVKRVLFEIFFKNKKSFALITSKDYNKNSNLQNNEFMGGYKMQHGVLRHLCRVCLKQRYFRC